MDMSFYAASVGVRTQQEKMDVVANNIANVNTTGYKAKHVAFQELVYGNMRAPEGELTDLTAGAGTKVSHTNTNYSEAGLEATGGAYDYAISGEGFFMLMDPLTNDITYTRNGNFYKSLRTDGFYLATDGDKLVLDRNGNPIQVNDTELSGDIGVFTFANTDGMESVGLTEFVPLEKNGEPQLDISANILEGYLEFSNVDLAEEMAHTIEASRAYSYILKMMQVSDETVQTINQLRG